MGQNNFNLSLDQLAVASPTEHLSALMQEGRFEDAASACGVLISEHPQDAAPYLCLAQLAQMAGDLQSSANFLGEAIVRNPTNGSAFSHLSDVLWNQERHDFAIRALETALSLGCDNAERRRTLADRLYQVGARVRASQTYLKVLELEPNCARSKAMLSLLAPNQPGPDVQGGDHGTGCGDVLLDRNPLWRRVHLCLISPPNYSHVKAFTELLASLRSSFAKIGCDTTFAINQSRPDAVNIIFCGHLMGAATDLSSFPSTTVVFNMEQATGFNLDRVPFYKVLLKRFAVWDYSPRNANVLRDLGASVSILRLGFDPSLEKIKPSSQKDTDVLFYGSLNARREAVLRDLRSAGLSVRHLFNVYDDERDQAIASARIVLNLHFYEDSIHEIVRTSYLLANRAAVVSECNASTEIDDDMREAVLAVPYEDIVSACVRLINNPQEREQLGLKGYEIFKKRNQVVSICETIEATHFSDRN